MNAMLTLFAPVEMMPALQSAVASVYRLDELVEIKDLLLEKPEASAFHLIIRQKDGIRQTIDWRNVSPPYLLPEEIPLNEHNLLGLVFARLGNFEKACEYLEGNAVLLNDVRILHRLQNGIPVDPSQLTSDFNAFEEYRFCHNSAILHHYAASERSFDADKTRYFYREALNSAPNGEYYAFTARHYATFLTDTSDLQQAETILQQAIPMALSDDAVPELKAGLCQAWMKKLVVPYDNALLDNLKNTLWEVLQHYRKQERETEEALLLIDAAQVANYAESFSESLGYINRAVDILRREGLVELLAQALHRRGILLYTWAKNGNPQFFRPALDSFQEALKTFNREDAPDVFADIQQYLGVIYSEMPDEEQKRSLWAGISSSSFQQALQFFQKETHPYEYAMVCNNYANALGKYPEAVHTDNFEKALFYYNEALEVRSAKAWPFERAVTLLNYVEACWHLNIAGKSNQALFEEMKTKTREAFELTTDPKMREEARNQMEKLETLRLVLDAEN